MSGNRTLTSFVGFQGFPGGTTGAQGPTGYQGSMGLPGQNGSTASSAGINAPYGGACSPKMNAVIGPNTSFTSVNASFILGPDIGGNGSILAQIPDNTTAGGDYRGFKEVDFQLGRNNSNEIADGGNSCIIGGSGNRISGLKVGIIGGKSNTALGNYSCIIGGTDNYTNGYYGSILGGENNNCSGSYSVIIGGESHVLSGSYSAIVGGYNHNITDNNFIILGGQNLSSGGSNQVFVAGKLYTQGFTYNGYATKILQISGDEVQYKTFGNINSDERLKKNIKEMTDDDFDVNKLKQLKYIKFRYNEKNRENRDINYGFSAQNMEHHLPHIIKDEEDGMKSMNIDSFIQYLFGVVRKRQNEIDELEKLVDSLESEIV